MPQLNNLHVQIISINYLFAKYKGMFSEKVIKVYTKCTYATIYY